MENFIFLPETILGSYSLAVAVKMVLAATGGAAIGFEREKHGRPAGLRTHLLVALGACLMMIISEAFALKYQGGADSVLRLDPARTAAQIVTGIGFLGAGVILKEGTTVRGLTTAASLWFVAGLGMAFGLGLIAPALAGTLLALFSLIVLKKIEPVLQKDRYLCLTVLARERTGLYEELERVFSRHNLRIANQSMDLDLVDEKVRYEFIVTRQRRRIGRELSGEIKEIEDVLRVKFS